MSYPLKVVDRNRCPVRGTVIPHCRMPKSSNVALLQKEYLFVFMEHPESSRLTHSLGQLAAEGADSARLARAIVSTWVDIESALAPVIGKRGFTALYERSLHVARAGHPWLAPAHEGVETIMDLTALKTALLGQDSASAAAGGSAHLEALYELLGSLISLSLTQRLLGPIWEHPLNDPTPEEASS
jgi:hypothetical protein